MKEKPFKFRIPIVGTRYVRVRVAGSVEEMWKDIEACHGIKHQHEFAATVWWPGTTDKGCFASIFYFWRGLRPWIISHEATHAAIAIAIATRKKGAELDDEVVASWNERITQAVWLKTQTAAL